MKKQTKTEMTLLPAEYIGKIPVRTDITVLPADDPKRRLIGWTVSYEQGMEIMKPFKGWIGELVARLKAVGYYGDVVSRHAVRSLRGIRKGDKVISFHLLGPEPTTVTEVDYRKKTASAESKYNLYPLKYSKRRGWTATCVINKRCFASLSPTKVT